MKRVLIITCYWPPAGGGGVLRWLKMAKYLPEWGWQPVICTPENPDPSVPDESLSDFLAIISISGHEKINRSDCSEFFL